MLLRSSSTPVLGSLVSSIAADSPNNNNNYHETSSPFRQHYPSSSFHGHNHTRLSFHPSPSSLHLSMAVSCGSSPISPSVADHFSDFELKGIRRAQSDGNLEGLAYSACNGNEEKKLSARNKCLMLQTIPSFSFYSSGARCEEEDDEEEEDESDFEGEDEDELEENEETVMAAVNGRSHGFNSISLENLLLNDQVKVTDEKGLVGQEMILPIGLESAVGGGSRSGGGWGGGGGGEFNSAGSNGDGEVEEYYKRMVEENPGNSLFLGNYAQFLYQSKRDLEGAEEYYSRAILADPRDGETLSQYAKLVWELHRDEERASSYFERAVQASPQDSHVHAAYASFLWDAEEDGNECAAPIDIDSIRSQIQRGALASA
ncbi:hypothetical protein HRI_003537700 [Hibiscus trionum]|uniref:Uncharacterized protein n=1 Tax=Hibiscus trionum TaxID=183268 RepID=A0A9W7ILA4_HIBTR|nr:hypothetical protein HRI_003537700 [Hibiscus trionum]